MIIDIKTNSILIKKLLYDTVSLRLEIDFNANFKKRETYVGITNEEFELLSKLENRDTYYFNQIKNRKKMSDKKQPKGINKSSKEKRYIRFRIDVTKINKDYLYVGEKGVYLDACLHMLPDGEVDKNENLGFITQEVPASIRKEDANAKGAILGNGREVEWQKQTNESTPGTELGVAKQGEDYLDDLPF